MAMKTLIEAPLSEIRVAGNKDNDSVWNFDYFAPGQSRANLPSGDYFTSVVAPPDKEKWHVKVIQIKVKDVNNPPEFVCVKRRELKLDEIEYYDSIINGGIYHRTVIVGSRKWARPKPIQDYIRKLSPDTIVLSGGAPGVDTMAVEFARKSGRPVWVTPAQWEKFGRGAGYRRNIEMIDHAHEVVAFWDGQSPGTKHSIEYATLKNKLKAIIRQ
jgi:hypothetical protein